MKTIVVSLVLVTATWLVWISFGGSPSRLGLEPDARSGSLHDQQELALAKPEVGARSAISQADGGAGGGPQALRPRFVLLGTLESTPKHPLDGVEITIQDPVSGAELLRVSSNGDGKFQADLTRLRDAAERPAHATYRLLASVQDERFMPLLQIIEVVPSELKRNGGMVWLHLVLQPIGRVVEGRVALASDADTWMDGIELAVFELDADGVPRVFPVAQVSCDVRGEFTFRLPTARGPEVVVAVGEGLRPATWSLDGRGEPAGLVLAMDAGHAISGRVGRLMESGSVVSASLLPAAEDLRRDWNQLVWFEGGFERAYAQASTDSEGRFSLLGLAAASYRVGLSYVPNSITFLDTTQEIVAPTAGLELFVDCAELMVHVTSRGVAVPRATVTLAIRSSIMGGLVSTERAMSLQADLQGSVFAVVDSHDDMRLDVKLHGYAPYSAKVPALSPGDRSEILVELEPHEEPASLEIEFADTDVLPRAMRVHRQGDHEFNGPRGRGRDVALESGRLKLVRLLPGRYVLHLTPVPGGSGGDFMCGVPIDVTLEPGEAGIVRVVNHLGGRLRVDARGESLGEPNLGVVLRSESGTRVHLRFQTHFVDIGLASERAETTREWLDVLPSGYLAEASTNLLPGTYDLSVVGSEGLKQRQTIQISAGEVKDVVLR